MATLTLQLKRKWFEMIRDGVKLEEYREIKPHYIRQFIKFEPLKKDVIEHCKIGFDEGEINGMENDLLLLEYSKLVFALGYPKADDTSRRMEFKNPKIRIGEGLPEWGAEPGKIYFIITWER